MTRARTTLPLYAGLFLVSAAVLYLEVLQTRIFSVMLWHHVTYLVVTFTLLGFGAAGAFVAVRPSMLKGDLAQRLSTHAALFGITTVGAFATLSMVHLDTVNLLTDQYQYFLLFLYYIYLIVPYFFGGMVVVLLLSAMAEEVNRLYFVNLLGSGIGCLLFLPIIGSAGGAGSILVASTLGLLGAFSFSLAREGGLLGRVATGLLVLAAGIGIPFGDRIIDIQPAPSKVMSWAVREKGGVVETTRWDPICRVDVAAAPGQGKFIFQDGDAPTALIHWQPEYPMPCDHYGLSYLIQNKPKVLVIGVGGGQDIAQALSRGASKITAAEINPTIYDLMTGKYEEFSGGLYTRCGADVHVAEGRSFLRRSKELYDVIQMTGTDTYSALASGSYVLSESYLYTLNAFEDYLSHLDPNGVIGILRFRFHPPRECLRLVSIGAEALKRQGVEKPSQHIIVVSYDLPPEKEDSQDVRLSYAVMLFKKTPFTEDDIRKYERFCKLIPGPRGPYVLSYAPGRESEADFAQLLAAVDQGNEKAFYAECRYDVTPVTDDKPFFFAYHKWKAVLDKITAPNYQGLIGEDPVGLYILLSVLVESCVLVGLLILIPLFAFRRRGLKVTGSGRILFYFFALGLSYLFIEVACMQKFVLFLGHPTYSLSIVLFTFLLFSGFGSFFGRRFRDRPLAGIGIAVWCIGVLLVAYQLLLPEIFARTLALETLVRMAITVGLLAPLAFFMGMPFPLGIRIIDRHAPETVPWAFGVNGGASVFSSVAGVLLAMAFGFTSVFLVAGLLYIMGWFFFRKLALSTS